jgi:pimeloyl-ACP methyl ester carboxylesterase
MKRLLAIFALSLFVFGFQPLIAKAQELVGQWRGVASRQGADLPLEFAFEKSATEIKGFVTIRTLGGLNIPLKNISFESSNLRFDLPTDAGTFQFNGTVRGDSLTGFWNLFGFESQVTVKRSVAESLSYTQEETTCRNGEIALSGTLFVPKSRQKRHPALVFLHGSGTVTRDGNRFLADHFARRGVATLIFDKRGSGSSTGNWLDADFNDLAHDALACVQLLKSRKDINSKKIGLIGASQAGWVGPLAASMSRDVAFLIIISGPTVTVDREGWWDAEFRLRSRGFTASEIEQALALLRMNDDVTRTGRGLAELEAAIERAKNERWFATLDLREPSAIDSPSRRWYQRLIDFNPVPFLEKISIPSLWIYGERDESIPSAESAAILEKLKRRGKDIAIKTFPKANHTLFVMPEENQPFRWIGFAPDYIETMTDWLLRHVNVK